MLTTQFIPAGTGITVPYAPISDGTRNNGGFVDTRGCPDRAAQINEGNKSKAMRAMLIAFSQPGSSCFSLGCDLGAHTEADGSATPCVAGGYIQFMEANYQAATAKDYFNRANCISHYAEKNSFQHDWRLEHVCTSVKFLLDGHTEILPSLWIWFYARARTPKLALRSRESLISALHAVIMAGKN